MSLEAVEVEVQPKEQSLESLGQQHSPQGAARQLSFDGGENALDLDALTIEFAREACPHQRPNPFDVPLRLASFSGND